jgi:hypothetical protein
MSVTVSRRAADLITKKQLVNQQVFIEESTNELRKVSEKRKKLVLAREYYAASRINGIVRGYLDRILCRGLMRIFRATMLLQRLFRGKLGRMRWMREYWRMRSVVRSNTALVVRKQDRVVCVGVGVGVDSSTVLSGLHSFAALNS